METFNETIINNLFELNIDEYFEKFYSIFYPNLDKTFMKFLLNADNTNADFYIDHETLKKFNLISSIKSNEVLKLIKSANLVKDVDYNIKQKNFTIGSKSSIFYNELEYKFILKSFKLLFILDKKNTLSQNKNIMEWIAYEECYRYYTNYLKLHSVNFSKYNSNILNSNKQLENKITELKENIDILRGNIEILNNKAEHLKIEFKDKMNTNIIDIKNTTSQIKNIVELNNSKKNANIFCPNYYKINNLYKYKMFLYNIVIIYLLRMFINFIL